MDQETKDVFRKWMDESEYSHWFLVKMLDGTKEEIHCTCTFENGEKIRKYYEDHNLLWKPSL